VQSRLDRYVLREMVVPFLIGQAAVVMMLTGTVLFNNADTFLNFGIPAAGVAKIAGYFLPFLVSLTMPVATAIAASLTVSRLARDSEVTVMRAAGIPLRRIFRPIVLVGLLLSFLDFQFAERVVPAASLKLQTTLTDLSRSARFLQPQAKQFVQSADKRYAVYVGSIELESERRARLRDVMIWITGATGSTPTVITAPEAEYADGVWNLLRSHTHLYEQGGRKEKYIYSESMPLNLRLAERAFNAIVLQLPFYSDATQRTFAELGRDLSQQRRIGYVNKRDQLEYYFKLSVPLSCLVFALVCPPLALRFARAGSFMGVLLSIVLVFVYWNTLLFSKILGARFPDVFPPWLAGWGQNALFSLIGIYALWRQE
jgi:lipopolysaccharide export system permease protein